ncbi:aminotransferase class I/II-fold pyridoxal phosphate-dependent enzyme [Gammaproteobacteria bacterium]|jgi:DNA-binding transcriptional MocR family regulator|nr:aminotransferase class I/II-fold pyridoxal phosphate-dependent enzyme [Gammaproteobacteria bacterium]
MKKIERAELQAKYNSIKKLKLNLDLTRGKPSSDQLDLSNLVMINLKSKKDFKLDNADIRNYGEIDGLPSAKKLGSLLLNVKPKNIIVNGTSSLNLTAIMLQTLFFKGNGDGPWKDKKKVSVICPVPGYDRHFSLLEEMGINMITVSMTGQGPNMDEVEAIIKKDKSVKGIICVPKHSNPTGETYSRETITRLAKLPKKSSKDFMIFYDNAYAVHDFKKSPKLSNIFKQCEKFKTSNNISLFASTSKITFAGSGIAFMGGSEKTIKTFVSYLEKVMVGSDKINQARHVKFFKNPKALEDHMKDLSSLIRPKFEIVEEYLSRLPEGYANWSTPTGGYFVSFNSKPGKAKKIHKLCSDAGLKLTPVGSTFPYKKDPKNQNIRIAPTQVKNSDLKKAMELFVTAVCLSG